MTAPLFNIGDIYEMFLEVSNDNDEKIKLLLKDMKSYPVVYKKLFTMKKFGEKYCSPFGVWELMFKHKSVDFVKRFEDVMDFSITNKAGDNILGIALNVGCQEITDYLFDLIKKRNIHPNVWIGSKDVYSMYTEHETNYGVLFSLMSALKPDNLYILESVPDILSLREASVYISVMLANSTLSDDNKMNTIKKIKDKDLKLVDMENNIIRLLSEYRDPFYYYTSSVNFDKMSYLGRDRIEATLSDIELRILTEDTAIINKVGKGIKL